MTATSSWASSQLLRLAGLEVGVVEQGGPNQGPRVEEYLRVAGLTPGQPWCAAFVAWVGKQLGGWPLKPWGGCQALHDEAMRRGMLGSMVPGAVFLLWHPSLNRFAHTGFVERIDFDLDGRGRTIEGNTNPDGGREGYGVFRRTRTFSAQDRFIHWWHTL